MAEVTRKSNEANGSSQGSDERREIKAITDIKGYKNLCCLCIEKILLEYTNYDKGLDIALNELSVSEVQTKLLELYSIDVKDDFVRDLLNALHDYYSWCNQQLCEEGLTNIFSDTILHKTPDDDGETTKGNKKRRYSISHALSKSEVEHLARQCRNRGDLANPEQVIEALAAIIGDSDREGIKEVTLDPTRQFLTGMLKTKDIIDQAIRSRQTVSFKYSDSGERVDYCPLCTGQDDGYYYMVAKAKTTRKSTYLGKPNKFRVFRIDLISDAKASGVANNVIEKQYVKLQEEAESFLASSVNRMPSVDIDDVYVKCLKESKESYLERKFSDHGCEKLRTNEGDLVYRITGVSLPGMKAWALGWLDCFEIVGPPELRKDIIETIKKNVYNGS